MSPIFITGGTGYIGKRLIKKLVTRGYDVTALVRKGSEKRLPKGVRAIIADPFDGSTFREWIPKNAIYIQLLGVPHPSPRKKTQFRDIDLKSVKTSADVAQQAAVAHFIYLSVAMTPSNIMKDYQEVRQEGEAYLRSKNLPSTFIRPWYVLGPGHLWPAFLYPAYAVAKLVPSLKQKAGAYSIVTIGQVLKTLLHVIESPPPKLRIIEVKHIKKDILPSI